MQVAFSWRKSGIGQQDVAARNFRHAARDNHRVGRGVAINMCAIGERPAAEARSNILQERG
jgi:hypothetical protein